MPNDERYDTDEENGPEEFEHHRHDRTPHKDEARRVRRLPVILQWIGAKSNALFFVGRTFLSAGRQECLPHIQSRGLGNATSAAPELVCNRCQASPEMSSICCKRVAR